MRVNYAVLQRNKHSTDYEVISKGLGRKRFWDRYQEARTHRHTRFVNLNNGAQVESGRGEWHSA